MVDGLPRDGVTVKLYAAATLGSPPAKNTALPSTGILQTATTGDTHGGDGAYRFTGVTAGTYYVGGTFNGTTTWDSFNVQSDLAASVKTYGALGDGVTNDTPAVQAALDDTAVSRIYFPPGTYLLGNLTINRNNLIVEGEGAVLKWTGTAGAGNQIGLQVSGSVTNVTIQHLRFLGDGVAANGHAAVWCNPGLTLTDVRVADCYVESCTVGVSLDCSTSGSILGAMIESNHFTTVVGTGAGQGEAVYFSGSTSVSCRSGIINNTVVGDQHYAFHLDRSFGVLLSGNRIINHRSTGNSGGQVPAIRVTQCGDIIIEKNVLDTFYDGAIEVVSTGAGVRDIVIEGNILANLANAVEEIVIGTGTPAADSFPQAVTIRGNCIFRDGRSVAPIRINCGKRVRVEGNVITMTSLASLTAAVRLRGDGEGGATNTYSDDISITGNTLYGTTSGGTFVGASMTAAFGGSTIRVENYGNRCSGGNYFHHDGASVTNPNVVYSGQDGLGLTMATTVAAPAIYSSPTIDLIPVTSTSTTPYNAPATDEMIVVDSSGGAKTVNLPTAVGKKGRSYGVKRVGGNNVTVDGSGAETIDGQLTATLTATLASIVVVSDGANWHIRASTGTYTTP